MTDSIDKAAEFPQGEQTQALSAPRRRVIKVCREPEGPDQISYEKWEELGSELGADCPRVKEFLRERDAQREAEMPKSDSSLAAIKAAANASMPNVPVGSSRDRVGLVASGNPDVLVEAANREPNVGYKSGPAWREGLKNGTPVQHSPGKLDTKDVGRSKPITE